MKRAHHSRKMESDRAEAPQATRPSTDDGRLGPQPSASALTEPEPVRDASGTGGASGGLNSSVNGVAGASIDTTPKGPPNRKAADPRAARRG
jgi:hypothetical protein